MGPFLTAILKFFSPALKLFGAGKQKLSQSYAGSKLLRDVGVKEDPKSTGSLYHATLLELERNRGKHPLLIEAFSRVSAKESFKKDYHARNGGFPLFESDLRTTIDTDDRFADIRYVDLKKEIKEFSAIFDDKVSAGMTPQEIALSNQMRSQQFLPVDPAAIDLSEYIENIVSLREDKRHRSVLKLLEQFKSKSWQNLSPELKYKVTLNFAFTYYELDEKAAAATYFIQLQDFSIKSDEALAYAAMGHSLLGEYSAAIELAKKAIKLNSHNETAYLALFFSYDETLELADLDGIIPPDMQQHPGIALNIAALKEKKGDYEGAFKLFSGIYESFTVYDPLKIDVCVVLGVNRIRSVEIKDDFFFGQLSDESIASIAYAVEKFTEAWDQVKESDLKENRAYILTNRGVAYNLLQKTDLARQDFLASLALKLTYFTYRQLLILDLESTDQFLRYLQEMADIPVSTAESLEFAIFKAQGEMLAGNNEQALQLLLGQFPNVKATLHRQQYYSMLGDIYMKIGQFDLAEKYAQEAVDEFPNDPFGYYYLFKVNMRRKDEELAYSWLDKARELITVSSPRHVSSYVADAYMAKQDFAKAASILEKIASRTKPSRLTITLLELYFKMGHYSKAVAIIEPLIEVYPDNDRLVDIYSGILDALEDYNRGIEVIKKLLGYYPDNQYMITKLAILYYKAGSYGLSAEIIDSMNDYFGLPLDYQFLFADAYLKNGDYLKAMELAYRIRQNHITDLTVHGKYIRFQAFVKAPDILPPHPEEVGLDCYVELLSEEGEKKGFVIVKRPEFPGEIPEEDLLAQQLLAKAAGDMIQVGQEKFTINVIMMKYVHAFQESIDQVYMRPGAHPIHVGKFSKDATPEENISRLMALAPAAREGDAELRAYYQRGLVTIGAVASMLGIGTIKYWGSLATSPDPGIFSMGGNPTERQVAITHFNDGKDIVADITALLGALHSGSLRFWKNLPGKLFVTRSTYELITEEIAELNVDIDKESMHVLRVGGRYVRSITTPEEKRRRLEKITELRQFLDETAAVILPAATDNFNEKKERDRLLGKSFNESVLVAVQQGLLLLSDDTRLRVLALNMHGVYGCGGIHLLDHLVQGGIVTQPDFGHCMMEYITLNYRGVPVNENVLIELAIRSRFSVAHPFLNGLDVLNPGLMDQQAVKLVVDFFYVLVQSTAPPQARDLMMQFVLTRMFAGRNAATSKSLFVEYLNYKFRLLPLLLTEIVEMVSIHF
jgi:tetratricopeptide (TPR) repeat protein